MNPTTTSTVSPLRQRMLDDMRLRKLEAKTRSMYIRAVRRLAMYLGRSPDTVSGEDLRGFHLHLVDTGLSPVTINATITALKFFCEATLRRPELIADLHPVRMARTLPVVLSRDEVARLITAASNLKHRTALCVAYGAGLRASEVIALKVGDVDSKRMTLRVEQGKGRKDRYAMLSPELLQRLRTWYRVAHAKGKILPRRVAVPGARSDGPNERAPAQPRDPCRGRRRTDRQARVAAYAAPQLCHAPAGAEGQYPRDPGAVGAQEAGDHLDVHARGHATTA
jgi:integrase